MIAHQRGLPRGPLEQRKYPEYNLKILQKDPRTKHPGVFVYVRNMIENKWTKEKQREWIKQHTLTPEQARKMLDQKLERIVKLALTPEQARKMLDQKLERIVKLALAQRKVNERLGIR